MSFRPITDVCSVCDQADCTSDHESYRNRLMVEHLCEQCGAGFSSIKPEPRFCSHECYLECSRDDFGESAKKLWQDGEFRERIANARRDAGYPDTNRPAAVARRKLRTAAKNAVRRILNRCLERKCSSVVTMLGYSVDDLRRHLEGLFLPGMTWANYGEWEIDHIRPISSFPLDTPVCEISALSNLQPLWKVDNRSKGATW